MNLLIDLNKRDWGENHEKSETVWASNKRVSGIFPKIPKITRIAKITKNVVNEQFLLFLSIFITNYAHK